MLLAHIDEIGETGAFVSRDHGHYNTSPAFGYAGFIIPEGRARDFGAVFDRETRTVFKRLIEQEDYPGRWEQTGAEVLSVRAPETHPGHLRVFDHLVRTLTHTGGNLFYYADEKPVETSKRLISAARGAHSGGRHGPGTRGLIPAARGALVS